MINHIFQRKFRGDVLPDTVWSVLQDAYATEFAGNQIKAGFLSKVAAIAWANDYPDIFKEYLKREGVHYDL